MLTNKKNKEVDVIEKVLDACYKANPDALFIMSLMHQYEERGSLSKKQLQGLHAKASKVEDMPVNWLATLEATILKMPNRFKSEAPAPAPVFVKDTHTTELINSILAKYPQHKRVLYFKLKDDKNEALSPAEIAELERFWKVLK